MNNGYSDHMTGNRKLFVQFDENLTTGIKLGNGKMHLAIPSFFFLISPD